SLAARLPRGWPASGWPDAGRGTSARTALTRRSQGALTETITVRSGLGPPLGGHTGAGVVPPSGGGRAPRRPPPTSFCCRPSPGAGAVRAMPRDTSRRPQALSAIAQAKREHLGGASRSHTVIVGERLDHGA